MLSPLFDLQSGAVMAVLAAVCAKMPEAKLGIIFLPMITFTAGNVREWKCVMCALQKKKSSCYVATISEV